jgi:hypothetical protein
MVGTCVWMNEIQLPGLLTSLSSISRTSSGFFIVDSLNLLLIQLHCYIEGACIPGYEISTAFALGGG